MKKLLLTLLILSTIIYSQEYNLVKEYTSIKQAQVSNPAWIYKDFSANNHSYNVIFDNESGKGKLPYEPENNLSLDYIAKGERELFPGSVFSGYVSFHQQKIGGKQWLHNRMPYQGFPFLLGDSSTGDYNLNGIHWQLGYSQELIQDKLFVGSRLFYNVDEEMKQVFPKPINKHRDIYFSLGLGTILNEHVKLGFTYNYMDIQEILKTTKYSLNQDMTPIFFKIRGLDNPLVFYAITGIERNMDFYGSSYRIDGEMNYGFLNKLSFVAGINSFDAEATDGTTDPINQGKSNINESFFSAELLLPLWNENNLHFFSYGNQSEQIAKHPELKVDIFNHIQKKLAIGAGLKITIAERIGINPNIHGSSQYLKREDLFNGILEYYPSSSLGGSCDLIWKSGGKIDFQIQPGYETETIDDVEIFSERTEWYYHQVTELEQKYYSSDKTRFWLNSQVRYRINDTKNIVLKMNYDNLSLENFDDKTRSGLNFSLCFEIMN